MTTLQMEFKLKLHAMTPTKAHGTDAGFDLYASENAVIPPKSGIKVQTGVAVDIVPGYVGLVFSRSGMGVNWIRLSNCVGVIDSGYHGDITILLHNDGDIAKYINIHDKIAQLVILPIPRVELKFVEDFSVETARGEKGFGSTGA
jgi:dUTP pyrophosphatase